MTRTQKNILWIIIEKTISVVGLFFINALVAKYVGPVVLGQIAIATAIFQIVQVAGVFGSDNILYKRMSINFTGGIELIIPVFVLRNAIFIILAFASVIFFNMSMDFTGLMLVLSVCVAYYFYTIDTFTSINELLLKSKINAFANVAGLVVGLTIRALMVKYSVPVIYFGFPLIIISAIPYIIKLCIFRLKFGGKKKFKTKMFKKRFAYLSQTGCILVIPSIIASIYPRLNIFVISFLYGSHDAGIYSVSQTLATCWSFILLSLLTSCLPLIFKEKDNLKVINLGATLHLNIILLAIPVILMMVFLINYIVLYIYGPAYTRSITPCVILCFSTLLSTLGVASSKIIIKFSGYKFLLYKTIFILTLSFFLSYLFSIRFGLIGAASAITVTEFFSLTVVNYLFMQGIILMVHIKMFKVLYKNIRGFLVLIIQMLNKIKF